MSKTFEIDFGFAEKFIRFTDPQYLKVYLYLMYYFRKTGIMLSEKELCKKLHLNSEIVDAALDYWETNDILTQNDGVYSFTQIPVSKPSRTTPVGAHSRPSYTSAEIDAAMTKNKDISYLFKQSEKILGKLISNSEAEMLYSFIDWLGLPVEVIIMLLTFAAGQGKTTRRYLETVACDWADKGINTYESAEEYIKELELKRSKEGKIRSILGIYDRALTATEKKYITAWTETTPVSVELISLAYDRTVNSTGKLQWAYMNKIIATWHSLGLTTVEDIEKHDADYKPNMKKPQNNSAPKSKFNNYVDTNKTDYTKYAEQLLSDMLEE